MLSIIKTVVDNNYSGHDKFYWYNTTSGKKHKYLFHGRVRDHNETGTC